MDEHSSDHNSAMFHHLHGCEALKFLFSLNDLPECCNNKADVANSKSHVHQTILTSVTISACNNNHNQLCFLESLLIKGTLSRGFLRFGVENVLKITLNASSRTQNTTRTSRERSQMIFSKEEQTISYW